MRKRVFKETDTVTVTSRTALEPLALEMAFLSTHQRIYEYLQILADTTSDAMIALNQDFQILGVNHAMTTTFGWSAEDAVGRRCTEVLRCRNLNRTMLCGTSS